MNLYQIHIDTLRQFAELGEYLKSFHPAMRAQILEYKREPDQWRGVAGKLLLRYGLKRAGIADMPTALDIDRKGRPSVAHEALDFNISHSGDQAVCVIADGIRCGIDIELHRPVDIDIFKRNFKDHEWASITGSDDPSAAFFRLWAIKESIIKADGRGVEVLGKTEILSRKHALCDGQTWFYEVLELADGYSSAVAFQHRPLIHRVQPSAQQLLDRK